MLNNARTGQHAGSMGVISIDQVYIRQNALNLSNRLLQNLILSSQCNQTRTEFVQSFVRQRALAYGVNTTSSLVNLEDHQLNVQRVLEDPLRRYVLADEVGLGKTIEAGFVVRQTMIDNNFDARICILCPEALMKQWSMELAEKFQLQLFLVLPLSLECKLEPQVSIVSHQIQNKTRNVIYDLVIIDEAHKIAGTTPLFWVSYSSMFQISQETLRVFCCFRQHPHFITSWDFCRCYQ